MNKKAFTLAEIVVTLGIIGIVTAMTAPSLLNLMPDKSKVEVLKAHKLINDATSELLDDTGIYYSDGTCVGLDCTEKPDRILQGETATTMATYVGDKKYPKLLCSKFLSDGCTETTNQEAGTFTVTFTTIDGSNWTVTNAKKITIDINGSKGPNKVYSSGYTEKDIDRYEFNVSSRGIVTGNDPLTKAYLGNRDKLNDKAHDYTTASKEIESES